MPLSRFLLLLITVIALAGLTALVLAQVSPGLGLVGLSAVVAVVLGLRLLVGGGK